VVLTPPLEAWPDRRDGFDASLAVPPFELDDVTGRFRRRLVETLREHRGIAILDLDTDQVEADGLTDPAPRLSPKTPTSPPDHRFPAAAYEACLTADQVDAVAAFESLLDSDRAVVLEADRGRGKSSAAGLAAGAFAIDGEDVLVTAPAARNAAELFNRAGELCKRLEGDTAIVEPRRIETATGGSIGFREPPDAIADLESADVVVVDEAAALPVATLESLLTAGRVAFATTIHGYEGAGRGSRSDSAIGSSRATTPLPTARSWNPSGTRRAIRSKCGPSVRCCSTLAHR